VNQHAKPCRNFGFVYRAAGHEDDLLPQGRPRNCSRCSRTSAVIDSRREENSRIISPLMPLISNPCPSSRAVHSRPNRVVRASSRCWDVQLHVTVAGGVLQPVRHGQVGFVPLAGLPPVHPHVVRAGAGVPDFPLEVAEPGPECLPDHLVDLADQARPVLVTFSVADLAGQAGVLAEGGVEDRDRLVGVPKTRFVCGVFEVRDVV
jgi:hypothetical protein